MLGNILDKFNDYKELAKGIMELNELVPDKEHGWRDIAPIYHSEAELEVVKIAYSEEFRLVFAYIRALLQKNELSERALALTTEAARLNPANYTLWEYRRNILKALDSDLREELEFTAECTVDSHKNYQLWHHRRLLVDWLKDPSDERAFTERLLKIDEKNYHAWQHRHYIMSTYNLWQPEDGTESELEFTSRMIAEDIRNNSAWNHRYTAIANTTGFTPEVVQREIKICIEAITKTPHNESAWNYLSGVLMDAPEGGLTPEVWSFCEDLYEKSVKRRSPYLISFMVDALMENADKRHNAHELERAEQLLQELMKIDPIRRNYWKHRMRALDTLKPTIVTNT